VTKNDKKLFAYFGVNVKILPPLRILNPQLISIAIREGCHINAFRDSSFFCWTMFRRDIVMTLIRRIINTNLGLKSDTRTRLVDFGNVLGKNLQNSRSDDRRNGTMHRF
jgi:hypothetical protein